MAKPVNEKVSSAGDGLNLLKLDNPKEIQIPAHFKSLINRILNDESTSEDIRLCDSSELHYFSVWKQEHLDLRDIESYWCLFSLQEQKVIHSLDPEQLIPYIAYRRSFRDGINRYQLEAKPIFCLIELTSACNIKCPFCFQSDPTFTKPELMGHMDLELAKKIIDEADTLRIRGITFASRGEPLLYKYLPELLAYLETKRHILEIKVNTNAKRLTEPTLNMLLGSKANILVISTDHYLKDQYEHYRKGASYDSFIINISRINPLRLAMGRSLTLYTRASGVAVDKHMNRQKFSQFYSDFFDEVGIVKMSERWDTYNNEVNPSDERACGLPFERLYIWFDGTANPCDTDYKSYLSPGNIVYSSISQVWTSLGKLRVSMLNGDRQLHTPCDRCYVA